jgi:hypothetical protein
VHYFKSYAYHKTGKAEYKKDNGVPEIEKHGGFYLTFFCRLLFIVL